MTKKISIYTDGSCSRQDGVDYGAIAIEIWHGNQCIHSHHQAVTGYSANACEVLAVVYALQWAGKHELEDVTIYSDSEYAIKGLTGIWSPKTNHDMWQLAKLLYQHTHSKITHVKAHDKCERNNRVDRLARATMRHSRPKH